jgi:hypothetical protein
MCAKERGDDHHFNGRHHQEEGNHERFDYRDQEEERDDRGRSFAGGFTEEISCSESRGGGITLAKRVRLACSDPISSTRLRLSYGAARAAIIFS